MKTDLRKTLKVTGEATLQATPDQAIITLGVHTENKDPTLAQQENSQTIAHVLSALHDLGIAEKNIKTSEYRIEPQYHYVEGKEIFHNYRVQHMIEIKTTNIDTVGTIVDTAVKQGANAISSIRFSLSNPNLYYQQTLTLALQNAYEKAHTLTEALQTPLHPIPIQIEELSSPAPLVLQANTFSKASTTPVMPGELTITATLRVEYSY